MPICASSIQLRRRPRNRPSTGSRSRSTTGAQKNLSVYASPTQDSMPMVVRSMPSSRSHADSVVNTSMKGSPAEKPRKSIASTRGCR